MGRSRKQRFSIAPLVFVVATALLGCSHSESGKVSHFEHDHDVAEHWPSDLEDLAGKLRSRIARLRDQADVVARHEVEDLVGWVGEVAADTDLTESDWVPLYERSEAIAAKVKRSEEHVPAELLTEIESLCELIETSAASLSKSDGPSREMES